MIVQGKNIARGLLMLLIFVNMAVVFCFSAQVGGESSETSGGVADFAARIFVHGFDMMDEEEQAAAVAAFQTPIRKLGHALEFASLGFLLAALFFHYEINNKIRIYLSFSAGALYAASDEIHQIFVPGRGPSIGDVFIDCLGVAAGIGIAFIAAAFMRRIKTESQK